MSYSELGVMKLHNNGITTTSGFKFNANMPLDDREVVTHESDLDALVKAGIAYEGMRVYVTDTQKSYILKNSGWTPEIVKSDIPTKTSDIQNNTGFITKDASNLTNYTKTTDLKDNIVNPIDNYSNISKGIIYKDNYNGSLCILSETSNIYATPEIGAPYSTPYYIERPSDELKITYRFLSDGAIDTSVTVDLFTGECRTIDNLYGGVTDSQLNLSPVWIGDHRYYKFTDFMPHFYTDYWNQVTVENVECSDWVRDNTHVLLLSPIATTSFITEDQLIQQYSSNDRDMASLYRYRNELGTLDIVPVALDDVSTDELIVMNDTTGTILYEYRSAETIQIYFDPSAQMSGLLYEDHSGSAIYDITPVETTDTYKVYDMAAIAFDLGYGYEWGEGEFTVVELPPSNGFKKYGFSAFVTQSQLEAESGSSSNIVLATEADVTAIINKLK